MVELGPDPFASMAYHKLGEIYELLFANKKFSANEKKMKVELEYKSVQFLKAQRYYLKAVRLLHPQWTVASLYRLGSMYKQMYDDMIKAPIPPGLNKAQRERYKELLRGKIRNLLKKGAWILEHSLQKSRYLGVQNSPWIKKTRAKLKDISLEKLPLECLPEGVAALPACACSLARTSVFLACTTTHCVLWCRLSICLLA